MAKLAGYKIANLQESFNASVNTTSYPVEKGLPLTDSIQRQPKTFSISGKILGNYDIEASNIRDNIEKKMNSGAVVKYVGRIKVSNVLITSFTGTYDGTVANGFSTTIDLQEIRIANTPYVKKKTQKKNSGKKTVTKKTTSSNNKNNKKKYHMVKKGDTYGSVARKYGTTVSALRKLNPWSDRKIPIGAKMRIK